MQITARGPFHAASSPALVGKKYRPHDAESHAVTTTWNSMEHRGPRGLRASLPGSPRKDWPLLCI